MTNNPIDEQKHLDGLNVLLKLLRGWDDEGWQGGKYDVESRTQEFDQWLKNLTAAGWTRKDVYEVVCDLIKLNEKALSEKSMDVLDSFETSLTGFCHPSGITRFPGDPVEERAFIEYVYSKKWLE